MEAKTLACGYSYHTQPFQHHNPEGISIYLFRLQTEGHSYALIDGRMQRIEAGHLMLFKPGDSYRLVIGSEDDNRKGQPIASADYHLLCTGTWLEQWWKQTKRSQLVSIDLDDKVLSLWRMLILEKRRLDDEHQEFSGYLLRALVLSFDQAISAGSAYEGKSFVAARMMRFIEEHATTSFRLEDLAAYIGLSISRTVHLFKECYGKTIIQHTLDIRLAIAEERLKYSEMTLEQVAETCGFGSYSYFFRVFKKRFAMSPTEYKNRLLSDAASLKRHV
jgi:AraC family transcriptional regulator of arabinose operon